MNGEDLKNSILQQAIQGKLVEQRDEEGTAEELYQQIQEEKEKLVEDGEVKKQKKIPEITEEEIPFDIPKSWKWVRIDEILNFIDYRGKTPSKTDSGISLITASNVRKGFLDFTKPAFISEEEYYNRMSRGVTKKGDILFTTEAPMGNVAINTLETSSCGQRVITFQKYGTNELDNQLICYYIQSPSFQYELRNQSTGTTAKGIKASKLRSIVIPLPPLEEQKRIVAKIEELMPYVDQYDKAYKEVTALNEKFPEDMQKSILQYAIQGKLVEQREEEGTAEELYQQIQAEKERLVEEGEIKKQKKSPEIIERDEPFDIPKSWKWVSLELITYSLGQKVNQIKRSEILEVGEFPVVSQSMNTVEGYCNDESRILRIAPSSVIVFGDHSKTLKLIDFDFVIGADGTKILMPISLDPEFLYYVLNYNVINMRQRGYSRHFQFLKEKPIPLPPLEEQKRIVAKIEELMPLTERLE
ncbi:restriction endonuclease subunit S [Alkalibacillus sp. S2W]|uniref:restriction endonuclease subunit S n=1 Tax=Alkalibacillus sp. S2W TaxID=3386553 RepID=UPI00398D4F44